MTGRVCRGRFRPATRPRGSATAALVGLGLAILLALSWQLPASADREVRVGTYEYAPLVSTGPNGQPEGLFVDIVEDVARTEGWHVTYVPGTWQENLDRTTSGEIDLILGIGQVPERAVEFDLTSHPVLETYGQIFATSARYTTVLDLEGKRVAYLKGDLISSTYQDYARQFGVHTTPVGADSIDEAFGKLNRGEVDAVASEKFGAREYVQRYGLVGTPIVFHPSAMAFGTAKGKNPDLIRAFDAYLEAGQADPSSRYRQLVDKWTGEGPKVPPALLWGLGVAVGLLILFVGASVLLRREVDRQTRQLATQNERLSETEALYRTLFDESPDGVAILDPETLRPIAFNHAAHTMYGYTRDEFAGIDVSDLEAIPMPDIDREMIAQLRSCGRYESELTQRTKAGDRISVQATLQVIRPAEKPVIHAIFRDVTAKKRAEETNRADRLRLATLAELGQIKATSLTVPEICELVMNRSIEITNSEYGYLFLYDEETQILTNYAWSKGVLPICTTEERQLIYPLAKTGLWGEAIRQRRPIVTNDYAAPNPLKKGYPEGHAHLVRHMNLPVFDGDRIVAVVGVANKPEPYDDDDVRQLQLLMQGAWQIVQRTRGEEALRQSEERFRAIFEQAAVGIAQNDTSGRYLQVNQRYCDIVGYTREELLQHTLLQITHPDDLAITSARFVEMLTGKIDTYTVEKRSIRGDGSSVWVSVTTSLIRGVAGAPPYVMGVVQDISERKAAEAERERLLVEQVDARRRIEELAETARRRAAELQSVLDSAVEGVVVADAAGRVTLVNGAASRILGVLAGELVGRTISDLPARLRIRHPDGRPVSTDELVLAAAIAGETFVGREQIVWNSTTGRDVNVHLSAAPVRSTEGAITGAVVAIHDVTALTELDRLKDQFISVAAHELKTPVTIMKGYAQTLQKSGESLPAGQRRMLDAIVRGANRIDRIIIELLDASRLSLGRLNLNVEKVDISALVAEAVEQADVTTPRHRVRLVGAESATVLADAARIEQVIVNLLDNAVRYSPQDHEVEVRVSVPNGEAVVSVADHGVGIPADKQDRIFERFYRAHTGTPYDYGGMGVSLYVSREIVQRHGGRIWFESREGKGSTFHFSLPLAAE